jgi:hypothetical protein
MEEEQYMLDGHPSRCYRQGCQAPCGYIIMYRVAQTAYNAGFILHCGVIMGNILQWGNYQKIEDIYQCFK